MVGEHFTFNDASTMLRYFVSDHLGSIAVLTDEVGNVAERDYYDAWGKRRNADGTDATGVIASATTRGFTGQEHISNIGLINFNARIYDPTIGRFLSPDSVVENPYLSQMLNRYSYVGNNPLSFTDPSGNCFLGCIWQNSLFRSLLGIAVVAIFQQYELLALLENSVLGVSFGSVINAGITGGISGYITTGTAKGALISAGTAIAFAGVHFLKADLGLTAAPGQMPTVGQAIGSASLHGLVGGLSSVASGGKFSSGFLAAGIGDLASVGDSDELNTGDTVKHAVAGGLGSMLGGGKFANGATTGAFGYLFNGALKEQARSLSFQTISGGPGQSDWKIQWHVSGGTPGGGYIVQEVDISGTFTKDDGTILPISMRFWEAWKIFGGHSGTGATVDDEFGFTSPIDGSSAATTITATARFYDGLKLPDDFIIHNPATTALELRSTTINPNFSIENATAPVTRTDTYSWDERKVP